MPTLENIQGSSLVPDLLGAFQLGVKGFQEQKARQKTQDIFDEKIALADVLTDEDSTDEEREAARLNLTVLDPVVGKAVEDILNSRNDRVIAAAKKQANLDAARNLFISQGKTPEARRKRSASVIEQMKANGEDISDEMKVHEIPDQDKFDLNIERALSVAQSVATGLKDTFTTLADGTQVNNRTGERKAVPGAVTPKDILTAAGKRSVVPKGATLVGPDGVEIFQSPISAGGVEFAKPAVKDFTPESVGVASSKGGVLSDLEVTPELKAKLRGGDRFATGTNTLFSVGGKTFIATPVTERDDKGVLKTTTNITELKGPKGKPGAVVSRELGETPAQKKEREILTAGGKETAVLGAQAEGRPDVLEAEKRTAGRLSREQKSIQGGITAAESLPSLNRVITLLDLVETGGFDRAKIAITNALGITPANESELQNALLVEVLKQIKPIFGGQPSERETATLLEINQNFGKSTEGNVRLIKKGIALARERVAIAMTDARIAGDTRAVERMQRGLNLVLDVEGAGGGAQPAQPGGGGRNKVFNPATGRLE